MVKGETSKLRFRPLTLDDKVIKDGIEAVGTLTGKEPYFIVGGVGAQSYLPSSCRRPTADIDVCVVRPLNYADFKTFARKIIEYLRDNHYEVKERKHSRAYKLETENRENPEERLLIEFSRRNHLSFERNRARLERELTNAKSKILEGRESTYTVASPEDIVVPKMVRTINSVSRNPEFKEHVPEGRVALSDAYIQERLRFIADMREEASLSPGDVVAAEELRLVSDIYDMRILSEVAGLNPHYFTSVCSDWNALLEKTPQRDALLETVLPDVFERK